MMNRRDFLSATAGGLLLTVFSEEISKAQEAKTDTGTLVSLVKGKDRAASIQEAISLLGINPVQGKNVLLKPNFNTADPFPASTHNDTLEELIRHLQTMGAARITIGERSGPPDTKDVIRRKRIDALCEKLGVDLVDFERLPEDKWITINPRNSHWQNGFDVAKPVLDAECVVSTCCLKTHGYGGVFTMSLKLSVGITHKRNMRELHGSRQHMRKMIAEINQAYTPALILMDGKKVFTDGGPMQGTLKKGDVILAGSDRIAIDAVGLAILKDLGTNKHIMNKKIFDQEQIARAVDLGLGVKGPDNIHIVADDAQSKHYADRLTQILQKG